MFTRLAAQLSLPRWCWPLLWLLFGTQVSPAQTLALREFTIANGLPQSVVYSMCQDRDGRLWVGTQGGVCAFDGQHFATLTTAEGLPDNHVRAVAAAPNGTLWLGHAYGGVSWLRPGGRVRRCRPPGLGLPADVACVAPLGQTVWVGTGKGLFRLVCGATDTTVTTYGVAQGLPSASISHVAGAPGGRVWVGTVGGLVLLDANGQTATPLPLQVGQTLVHHFYQAADTVLWCATATGLLRLSGAGTAAQPWRTRRYGAAEGLCNSHVWRVIQDRSGRVWATTSAGLSVLPVGATRFRCLPSGGALNAPQANDLLEDHEGNIWFANDNGLAQHPTDERFEHYGRAAGVPDDEIEAIAQVAPGRYWVGTRAGLAELGAPEPNGEVRARPVALRPGENNQYVRCLYHDRRGGAWVGSQNGAARYDLATGRWQYFDQIPTLAGQAVVGISEDKAGRIWLATLGNGLTVLAPTTGSHRTFDVAHGGLGTSDLWQVFRDHTGTLWLATDNRGLVRIDTERETFTRVDGQPGALSVGSISEDRQGNLWLGTIGRGVLRYTPSTGQVRAYGAAQGLRSSNPYFVQCDSAGRVWAGTNRGLDCFDPATNRTVSYGAKEGFVGQETNQNAVLLDRGGQLWVGTVNGLMHYNPARALPNRMAPQTLLTGLRVTFRDTALVPGLTVPYRRNNVAFDYAGVCLTNPDKVRYQYRLVGFDDTWAGPLTTTTATYTNLPPGEYTFEVKAANNDGVWNPRPAAYSFTVLPPWWRTWWAYLLYASAFGLIIQGVRVNTRNRERDRADRALERQTLLHLQEMDQVKTDFFTNVSHEFRTPLTLILGPASQLATEAPDAATREQGGLVLRNARKLLLLINQILDLSKLEVGALKLLPTANDAAEFTRQVAAGFAELAARNGVTLPVEAPAASLPLVFDASKVEEILENLLANALRFTPAGGRVAVAVRETLPTPAAPQGGVEWSISDSGPGIAAEYLPRLFERFYQVPSAGVAATRTGSGIGLALVRELAELHGGTVAVRSAVGEGSSFVVWLPRLLQAVGAPGATAPDMAANIGLVETLADNGTASAAATVLPEPSAEVATSAGNVALSPADIDAEVVLIIEDNDEVRAFIAATLAPAGYRLLLAADGLAGVALAQAEVPDLVVSDIMMPGLDGYQVCAQLKTDPATSHVPVVLLTAKSGPDVRLEGLETGADSFLAKPFDPRELRAQVKNLLTLRQRVRDRFAAASAAPTEPAVPNTEHPTPNTQHPEAEMLQPEGHATPDPLVAHAAAVASLPSFDQKFLTKLNDIILQHLDDEGFGVDQLGQEIALSRTQLHRKLKALTGQSPGDCIRQTRLLRALALLQARIGTVAEVAYQVGFSSPNHFSTAFSRQFGYPPSAVGKQGEAVN